MLPPRQHVTFLFTDIERSSELWELHPQAMGRALAQHDDLLRGVFTERGGYVFKTMGDAFCVAFSSASDAVQAAVAGQRKLATAAWEDTGPLRVRMALHSGEAEQRDNDYFGPTLNRVARVLSTGHGGQTLLSSATAETVRPGLSAEITLRDLGERRLKDLSKPERIFQIVLKDLPAEFPPLRSLEVLPNNLPAQVTSFVGRGRDMAEVRRLMGTTRLLTLTGPGGTGKTRLSLQVAAELLDHFPHGVWLVELSTLAEAMLVPEAILTALDLRAEPDKSPLSTLTDALRTRHLLIVLDNCEHLIAGCAQIVTTLLRSCPQVKVLASSREPLSIAGEMLWPVTVLSVPEWNWQDREVTLEGIADLEAVQLFVDRAAAVKPGFALTDETAPLVAKICWRLDGIPLALELAAARVKVMPLAQILTRLDDRFRLLTGGSRSALPRQQTLGALIDWSFDLLSDPEKILLRRLTVFVAGRTLEMAETVCPGDGLEAVEVFDVLCSLVEKSLLMIEAGSDGENRYTLLESIWDYAAGKLEQAGETALYERKHLDYFVDLAETAAPHLTGADQQEWLECLSGEHHNLEKALETSLRSQETIQFGLRLAGALTRYWEVRSYLTEGYEQFSALLARMDDSAELAVQARAELGAARLSWCLDRDEQAMGHYRTAQRLYRSVDMKEEVGMIEAYLGFAERNEGNNAAATEHFLRAGKIGEELRSERIEALTLSGLSTVAAAEGRLGEARRMKDEGLRRYLAIGDRWVSSLITGSLGKVCFGLGDYAAARKHLREAMTISRELGNKWTIPYALEAIADVCAAQEQAAKAVRLYGAASSQREARALSFSPTEKISYQRALDELHRLVSREVFDEEWTRGRALGFQAAINLAMEAE